MKPSSPFLRWMRGIVAPVTLVASLLVVNAAVGLGRGSSPAVTPAAPPASNVSDEPAVAPPAEVTATAAVEAAPVVAPVAPATRSLTRDEMLQLMEEGYSGSDILEAGALLTEFGSDPGAVLRRHAGGEAWAEVRSAEQKRWSEQRAAELRANPTIALGADGKLQQTAAGLKVEEIKELIKQGYTPREIVEADALAFALELDVRQIVKEKRPDQSLLDAVQERHMRRTPAERQAVQRRNEMRSNPYASPDQTPQQGGGKQ